MSHTPGPWVKRGGMLIGADGTDVVAADLGLGLGADSGDGIRAANGRLIKAAPELLSWARWALHRLPDDVKESGQYEMAMAAIAKATGGTV